MDNTNDENLRKNLWQHQQHGTIDNNQQYYANQYQPIQHAGFDLQRELNSQPAPSASTENMQFLYDNHGPYLKIYFNENNMSDYELFDRNQQQQHQQQQNELPNFANNRDGMNNFLPNPQVQIPFYGSSSGSAGGPSKNPTTIQSSVIHHLVSSLGPNKTGSYSPFGETIINNANAIPPTANHSTNNSFTTSPQQPTNNPMESNRIPPFNAFNNESNVDLNLSRASIESSNSSAQLSTPNTSTVSPTSMNIKKTRIIAEVKPMRMSYSDVVSKNGVNGQPTTFGNTNSASSSPNTTLPLSNKNMKIDKVSRGNFDKRDGGDKENQAKNKKSPINTNNSTSGNPNNFSDSKKSQSMSGKSYEKSSTNSTLNQTSNSKKKTSQGLSKETSTSSIGTAKNPLNATEAAKDSKVKSASDSDDDDDNSSMNESDFNDIINDPLEFYNVRKNVYHGEHHNIEKIITTKGLASTNYRKMKSASANVSTKKTEKAQRRTGKSTNRKRQKHEVLMKLFMAWAEYLLKFFQWLWTLIYDVGYLSFGIIWDRMSWCYQCSMQGVEAARRELSGSPGKAVWVWMKDLWKRFDNKFDKKSRWAFWRWLFKKKQPINEQVKDHYKDGKLPKTAEEAMKSLLNCKGKDPYSILGVNPNCSQEQIRKHYKKIAVLVHPDKNKQPGAEEAFKVLQRSFELIGEPESRQHYDQSVAKALNAEKAFTELSDLLVQLQTKISEAANTIRCSSCCFRHPRKPTGRKHFAARECSTCKIRHPAREGDIWAETSFFGFRWKYLALMEGNVYDITQWALCQRGALSHLQANSCVVQYKIVLGGNGGNQQQNQSHEKEKFKKDVPVSEPSMDDFFLNNIYAGQNPQQQHQNPRRRFKKN
ncbi:CLUMA_CG001779, isoform A [Clunio marinus]|uniref:CLUMA_CG001779, isoform A n=1 Tax=Clunio marinus TaxID=568069 RepID=A0A1J1HP46_9DIPT|nr:CLUMA_CG001779, isoform A [Clunio marinus]